MTPAASHIINPEQAITLHGLFLERVRSTPDAVAYRYFDATQDAWLALTWAQMQAEVARWQAALAREGLSAGDRVAVMLRNCPQWVMYEQAALSLGLVVVPLYTVDRSGNIAHILRDSGAQVLLFENAEQWQELQGVCGELPGVRRMLSVDAIACPQEPRLRHVQAWLPAAATLLPERTRDGKALATIMYTSGTTGHPKGVMLSHHNILFDAYASLSTCVISNQDTMLSFLPLSHAFERTTGYYMSMMSGTVVAYARSIAMLAADLQTVRPTILISVPRIYERIYATILSMLDVGHPLQRKLFDLAVDTGWQRFEYEQGRAAWHPRLLLWPLLNVLVARKVMARLGGRVRVTVSGGAALPAEVARVFIALGLPIVQGYGMTETSPVVCVNWLQANVPSSVGLPLPGIEVRLGEHNALLVRGPCNMQGYWNNPQATAAMISPDGWLNTGDTAHISASGHITITGRLKEIIVMSNGEKVPPADMEQAILRDRLFEQVMIDGEGQPYLVALLVVNAENWKRLAQEVGVRPDMPESLHDTRVEQRILQRIAAQLAQFPGYARVRRALLLTEAWSIENGLLTPTLKVKRAQVVTRYAEAIEQLYQGH